MVTGEKSTLKPLETGGGLITDEMGMGKTLSSLALIMHTLEAATTWAKDYSASERRVRATLVLVPNASECLKNLLLLSNTSSSFDQ